MALDMRRTKDSVRFEISDGDAVTVVVLLPEDDEAVLVRKLRRIVSLVEADLPPVGQTGGKVITLPTAVSPPRLGDQQRSNGWELYGDADNLPEA